MGGDKDKPLPYNKTEGAGFIPARSMWQQRFVEGFSPVLAIPPELRVPFFVSMVGGDEFVSTVTDTGQDVRLTLPMAG
jgi:hypothetical protein